MYIYVYTYIYIYIHMYIYTYTYICIYKQQHSKCSYRHRAHRQQAHTGGQGRNICIYICIYIQLYIHIYIYVYLYSNTESAATGIAHIDNESLLEGKGANRGIPQPAPASLTHHLGKEAVKKRREERLRGGGSRVIPLASDSTRVAGKKMMCMCA